MRLTLLALALLGPGAARADATSDHDAGVKAYRQGQSAEALRLFQRALEAGPVTPALRFNIALCQLRLRRYAEAQEQFLQLTRDESFRAAAEYHLGLIAYQQGRTDAALQHLNTAQSLDPQLKERAALARSRITGRPDSPITSVYLRGVAGYDSNVELVPHDAALGLSPEADGFTEATGNLEHRRGAWNFGGGFYSRSYWDLSQSDQLGLQLNAARNFLAPRWNLELGASATAVRLGGERLQEFSGLRFSALRRGSGAWQQRLRLDVDQVSAPQDFEYLRGWRARLQLSAIAIRFLGGYELEYNHRHDETLGNQFFSHSPLRHRAFASYRPNFLAPVETEFWADYRYSRYADPDRYLQGTTPLSERREESLAGLGLSARFPLTWGLRPRLALYAASNRSSVDSLEYDKLEFTAGFEYF